MKRLIILLLVSGFFVLSFGASKSKGPKPINENQREKIDRAKALMNLRAQDPELYIRFDDKTGCITTIDGNLTLPSSKEPSQIAFEFMDTYKVLLLIDKPLQEFIIQDKITDDLGLIHIKFNQVWQGLPIWGAQIGIHLKKDGSIYYVNGSYYPSPRINVEPMLTEEDGINAASKDYLNKDSSPIKSAKAKFIIYTSDGKEFNLVWNVIVQGTNIIDGWEYFVDAQTGKILYILPTIRSDGPVNGSGRDSKGINRNLHLYQIGSEYFLVDATKTMYRPPISNLNGVIVTCDCGGTYTSYSGVSSHSLTIADPIYVDAHYTFSEIYDFYNRIVGRSSWDGSGISIKVLVHYGVNHNNAYFMSSGSLFVFGDGDGSHYRPFTSADDISCHEFQHGVTHATADLIYHNQSGALNEAYSDIAGSTFDPDWEIGEDIKVSGGAMRFMDNPERADLPSHMRDYRYLPDNSEGDWGGVHYNMSIPCLAHVRMVDGEPHFSREQAFTIWYRSLSVYLTNSSDFMDGRDNFLQAAQDYYGSDSNWSEIYCAIKHAFYSVGLGDTCSGSGSGEWAGDFVYYWNDSAVDYYILDFPETTPGYEAIGYGVRFTIPSGGYRLGSIYFFLADVWTLNDMFIELYDPTFTFIDSVEIDNTALWYAVYGDTMSYPLVGINYGNDYLGDIYAFVYLEGGFLFGEYLSLVTDDATGSTEERNYYIGLDWNAYSLSSLYGSEYNIVSFATVTRLGDLQEPAYLLPDGRMLDLVASPTPFNSSIRFSYSIPILGDILVRDLTGRIVKQYKSLSGEGTVYWDAKDDHGSSLATGVYFVSLTDKIFPFPLTRKILFIK